MDIQLQVGKQFSSADDFFKAVTDYGGENYVYFVKRDSRLLSSRNRQLKKPFSEAQVQRLKYSHIQLTCKQFGKRKSQSTGIRPNQRWVRSRTMSAWSAETRESSWACFIIIDACAHALPGLKAYKLIDLTIVTSHVGSRSRSWDGKMRVCFAQACRRGSQLVAFLSRENCWSQSYWYIYLMEASTV